MTGIYKAEDDQLVGTNLNFVALLVVKPSRMRKKLSVVNLYEPRSQISFFCACGLGVLEQDLVGVHDTCMSCQLMIDHEHDRLAWRGERSWQWS